MKIYTSFFSAMIFIPVLLGLMDFSDIMILYKVLSSKFDLFPTSIKPLKVSKDLSGSSCFGETISVNDLYHVVSANEFG